MNRILITGGAGFIGHHIVEHLFKNTDWQIVILDRLSYSSSGLDRLRDIEVMKQLNEPGNRVKIFTADFINPIVDGLAQEIGQVDYILHMGAETHVDNSILNPEPFVMSNVLGTMNILNFARTQKNLKAMIYFSTDEVFGPAPEGVNFKDWDRYNSANPYAATKAGGEELCWSYANTYKLPIIITHTMNVFGERQHQEKFIPKVIRQVLNGETVTIHSNEDKTKAGSRYWIHARNVANALIFILDFFYPFPRTGPYNSAIDGTPKLYIRDKFNIVGEKEINNLEMARLIAKILDKELKYEMVDFHSSRPGHDLRYALNGSKMERMGWSLPMNFEESLRKTVEWTIKNDKWLKI